MIQEVNVQDVDQPANAAPPKSWRRRLLFPALTACLGLVAALIIAEISLRLCVEQEAKRMATYDSTLGWRGRPGGRGVYVRKSANIRVPFRYNNLGFRDDDVTPKPPGVHRIMLLGDSFVESLEVDDAYTLPALLENAVGKRSPDWEVAAIGSQGYSTAQELLAYRQYRNIVDPDVVLLCFYCGNDFEDNLRRRFAYLADDGQLHIPQNNDPGWKRLARWSQRWLYESSHVVFLVKNSIQSMTNITIAPASKNIVDADRRYQEEITASLMSKLADEVLADGGKFGIVIIPYREDLVSGNRECQDFVIQFADNQQIPCLDLSTSLKLDHFFQTDIHFNQQGQHVAAKAIDDFLASRFGLAGAAAAKPTDFVAEMDEEKN